LKTESAISRAFSPERRIVAMAPIPGDVAIAQMVI
jgi:hypothetical protein